MTPAIDLNVPYEEKDAAKALGAKWDPARKTWFIPNGLDPDDFEACGFGQPVDIFIEKYTPRALSLNDFRLAFLQENI